jgi:hypothetical protein
MWQEAAVPRLILAAVTPDNTPHGYNWTFAFPMLLFIVVALVLWVLFGRPHRRVPGEPISLATGSHLQASGPVLADTVLADTVLADTVLADTVLADTGQGESGSDETPADTDPADVDAAVSGEDPGASE